MISKISLMAFPQKQVGKSLFINVLSIIRNYNPLTTTDLNPAWIDANLRLQAVVIDSLEKYPSLGLGDPYDLPQVSIPPQAAAIFTSMQTRFNITKTANDATGRTDMKEFQVMKKYLPPSYREAFNFTSPRNKKLTVTGNEYQCAIKSNVKPNPDFGAAINDETSWGKVFAFCLRHKEIAKKCGFIHEMLEIKLDDNTYKNGGWLYVDLHPESSYFSDLQADANFVKRYAARIPKLDLSKSRDLFTAVAFPVLLSEDPPVGDDPVAPSTEILDQMFTEAAMYDDGFCKIVHNYQPVSNHLLNEEQDDESPVTSDIGIRLGWDDEQLAEWYARQMMEDPGTGKRADAPLGVFQYRVDVREKVTEGDPVNKWRSLCRVQYDKDVFLDNEQIGRAGEELELGVDVYPSKPDQEAGTHFWLPSYLTQWIGKSLALQDEDAIAIYHKDEPSVSHLQPQNEYDRADDRNFKATKNSYYKATGLENIQLLYGHEYEFRVRMADITGGGPTVDMEPQYESASPVTTCLFKRHVIPQQLNVITPLPLIDTEMFEGKELRIKRSILGYPSVLFTGAYLNGVAALTADADNILAQNLKRGPGLSDPDVDAVEITVEVRCLALDATIRKLHAKDNFAFLYQTRRSFDTALNSELNVKLNYIDAQQLSFNGSTQLDDLGLSTSGNNNINQRLDIVLPTARDIRITIRSVTTTKSDYYGGINEDGLNREELKGQKLTFFTRKTSLSEIDFFKLTGENMMIRGIYLQPEQPFKITADYKAVFIENLASSNEPPTLMDRLSAALGAESKGMSLLGRQGQRWQFGVSRFIRHTAAPDNTSVTFATKNDLLNHWIVPMTLLIKRDWSWDGAKPTSISVFRRKIFVRDAMDILNVTNRKNFVDEHPLKELFANVDIIAAAPEELIGDISMKQAINLPAITNADRSQTFACFIDAVDPAQNDEAKFPDEVLVSYRLKVHFKIDGNQALPKDKDQELYLHLPITITPAEIPKVVSAGISMSPYMRDEKYANTETRKKYLWVEFDKPLLNTDDTFFVRMLAYAPDVLLATWTPDLFIATKEPPLPLDAEYIRIISPGASDDSAGLFAMQEMIPATDSKVHYVLPLPPGMHTDAAELFGMFTYEFRVGHKHPWSTAHGRFGRALRSTGIQHPPPQLHCVPNRNERLITVSAPYAQTVFDGRNVTSKPPRTEIWALLYAQVRMADDTDMRNILLSDKKLRIQKSKIKKPVNQTEYLSISQQTTDSVPKGLAGWRNKEVEDLLASFGLPEDSDLSILCVEMMPGYENFFITKERGATAEKLMRSNNDSQPFGRDNIKGERNTVRLQDDLKEYVGFVAQGMSEMTNRIREEYSKRYASRTEEDNYIQHQEEKGPRPLTRDLGMQRILRTSNLVEVPAICCTV